MKIYLGGSCSSDKRTLMMNIATELRKHNYDVYCPFEMKIPNAWDMSQEEWSQKVFEEDLKHLDECEIFLMISSGRISTAGTNWEQGYAYAKRKKIIVLQYNDTNTSLMTYCSADKFVNSNEKNITNDVIYALNDGCTQHGICKTILT